FLAIGLLVPLTATPAEAACRLPSLIHFSDPRNQNTVVYNPVTGVLQFTLADGRKLVGQPARALRSGGELNVSFRSTSLTIAMRADLRTCRARAPAAAQLAARSPRAVR